MSLEYVFCVWEKFVKKSLLHLSKMYLFFPFPINFVKEWPTNVNETNVDNSSDTRFTFWPWCEDKTNGSKD